MTIRGVLDRALALVGSLSTTGDHVVEWTGYAIEESWTAWVVVQGDAEELVEDEGDQDGDASFLTLSVAAGATTPSIRDQAHAEVREAMARAPEFEWQGTTFPRPEIGATPTRS